MFEAVILIGGLGTRLKSISGNTPKPMMPVAGKPFVYHLLKKLEKAGCRRIILSLCYQADMIKKTIQADAPVDCELIFVVEDKPLGTGGGLKLASESVSGDSFIAINGDTYCGIDYLDFYKKSSGEDLVIAGVRVQNAERYGSLNFDANYNLTNMREKGIVGPAVINSGTYLIAKSSIRSIKKSEFSFEKYFVPRYLDKTKVYLFKGDFIDIGVPDDYHLACRTLL
jgi:D-glycero-alpha-D-manno-heptose 1-phosphate guanylyltransferase